MTELSIKLILEKLDKKMDRILAIVENLVVFPEKELTEEEMENLKKEWENQYVGREK